MSNVVVLSKEKVQLTSLYVWRNVSFAYLPLESFLSTQFIADKCLICVDPDYPADLSLALRIAERMNKVSVIEFRWPTDAPGDGSRIGIASQHALEHIPVQEGAYVLNVQADEIYPVGLAQYLCHTWWRYVQIGAECINLKVLNLEHNMQQYQGGDAGSTWEWQCGAGYNAAIKLFKRCDDIRFAHDGWSVDGCHAVYHDPFSLSYPILHAHDNFRDTLIGLRRAAAEEIWTDREKFGHYRQSADQIEESRETWWNDPKWTNPVAKFHHLLPDYVRPLVGQTHYSVRYDVLDAVLSEEEQ